VAAPVDALSVALLAEYRAVLLRPKVQSRHALSEDEVDAILGELTRSAVVGDPAAGDILAPDPGDQLLWDLVGSLAGAVLVTGDGGPQVDDALAVLSPRTRTIWSRPAAPSSGPVPARRCALGDRGVRSTGGEGRQGREGPPASP